MNQQDNFDTIIIGAGLAGLTLAMQLAHENEELKILVLDRRSELAPIATHKVGESFVELGSIYLREKLGLADYLDQNHLPKYGIRFFFDSPHKEQIEKRIEVGSKTYTQVKTNQVDRGMLENDLVKMVQDLGVRILFNTVVKDVELENKNHTLVYENEGIQTTVHSRWIIDASGRSGFLKRKLSLEKALDHSANAVWLRLDQSIDVDDWSEDEEWSKMYPSGIRKFSTTHLMGKGYWVWIIPLTSGATSIGIVSDPNQHTFDKMNTFEKALVWLESNEPYLAKVVQTASGKLLDFKMMKDFSYDVKKHFSEEGWAFTGESGTFIDPLYSPGTDFIALANTWITRLITSDSRGEKIKLPALVYNHKFQELIRGWTLIYKDKYDLFDKPQVLVMKVSWDWGTYWGNTALLFKNDAFLDIDFLKNYSAVGHQSLGLRFARINEAVQQLFSDWGNLDDNIYAPGIYNVFDNIYLKDFQFALLEDFSSEETINKVSKNIEQLEFMAAELYRIGILLTRGLNIDFPLDPCNTRITDSYDDLLDKSKNEKALAPNNSWRNELDKFMFIPVESTIHST